MQTFLPYENFTKTALVLDNKRLGKQRVEAYTILKILLGEAKKNKNGKVPWENHPAVKMWKGYEFALARYGLVVCDEWIQRGFKDSLRDFFQINCVMFYEKPFWLGYKKFHRSHQSNLLRKNFEYYKQYKWNVSDDLPYVWPV